MKLAINLSEIDFDKTPNPKSTIKSNPTILNEIPLGDLPVTRFKSGGYGLFPIVDGTPKITPSLTSSLAGWYYLQYQLNTPGLLSDLGSVREKAQATYDALTFDLGDFLADYWLYALMGEARHSNGCSGAYRSDNPYKCERCRKFLVQAYYAQRQPGATSIWKKFKSRGEALDLLLHSFMDHVWGGMCGGAPWGWITHITRELNLGVVTNNLDQISIAIDLLAYSHHCGGNLWHSRFDWSNWLWQSDINGLQIQGEIYHPISPIMSILWAKQIALPCCWTMIEKMIPDSMIFAKPDKTALCPKKGSIELYENKKGYWNAPYCKKMDAIHDAPAPEEAFRKLYPIKDRCPSCDKTVRSNGTCNFYCFFCKACKRSTEPHFHRCQTCTGTNSNFLKPGCDLRWCELCGMCKISWPHAEAHEANLAKQKPTSETPISKKRKPRSDKGVKRGPRAAKSEMHEFLDDKLGAKSKSIKKELLSK